MPGVKLRYGHESIALQLPQEIQPTFLTTAPPKTEQSEFQIIRDALDAPLDSPSLREFLQPHDNVTVIVSDKTRSCRTELFLPILLDEVQVCGIGRDRVTLIFANGTHAAQSEREMRGIIGDAVYDGYRVIQHDSRDGGSVEYAGTTKYGTDVFLNKAVTRASKVIATGAVVHHYFAGFGGGAKLFMPGVAAYSSAVCNHRRSLDEDGDFLSDCRDGNIATNPVALDILDAVRFFPPAFYFATILNSTGAIERAVCGDLLAAHAKGCEIIDEMYRCHIPAQADLTIVSAGGHPKDINFIQAHKALHRAAYATKKGGTILFLAECGDGIGNASFLPWFELTPVELRAALAERYGMNAHTAVAMRSKAREYSIHFLSSLPDGDIILMGMTPVHDLQSHIEKKIETLSPHSVVYLIGNGSLTIPTLLK